MESQITQEAEAELKLESVRQKLNDLRSQIRLLEKEEAAILEFLHPQRFVSSTFCQLPEDVIREIFVACLDIERNPSMSNRNPPMLLTQISSDLRRIALATPALWAAIHIPVIGKQLELICMAQVNCAKVMMEKRIEGVKVWLERSGSILPLSISVYCCSNYNQTAVLVHELLDILLVHRLRWRDLVVDHADSSLMGRIIRLTKADTPFLQCVTFRGYDTNVAWSQAELFNAPGLRELTVDMSGSGDILRLTSVNWTNLTVLFLNSTSGFNDLNDGARISDVIAVLRRTSQLVSLYTDLNLCGDILDESNITAEIYLPHLNTLTLRSITGRWDPNLWGSAPPDSENKVAILSILNAPILRAIGINGITCKRNPPLTAFLKRATNLREVYLAWSTFDVAVDYLRCCPMITSLHLHEMYTDQGDNSMGIESFLSNFATSAYQEGLCPQLEFVFCNIRETVTADTLRAFIIGKRGVVISTAVVPGTEEIFKNVIIEAKRDLGSVVKLYNNNGQYILNRDLDVRDPVPKSLYWWNTNISSIDETYDHFVEMVV